MGLGADPKALAWCVRGREVACVLARRNLARRFFRCSRSGACKENKSVQVFDTDASAAAAERLRRTQSRPMVLRALLEVQLLCAPGGTCCCADPILYTLPLPPLAPPHTRTQNPHRYRQAELVHCRWAMLGAAGVLGQEILNPSVNWYTEAALPQNLPAPFTNINMGGLLAWEFLMMHFVEVRRWQDIRKHGSVNEVSLLLVGVLLWLVGVGVLLLSLQQYPAATDSVRD